jgi:hypothetical protein
MASANPGYAEPDEDGLYTRWYVPSCPLGHECSAKASTTTDITTQHQKPATQTTTKHTTNTEHKHRTQQHNTNNIHTLSHNEQQQAKSAHNQKHHTTHQRPQTLTTPQSHTKKTTTDKSTPQCFRKAWSAQRKCASFVSWDVCYGKLVHHITNSSLHQTEGRTYADIEKQCVEGSKMIEVELVDASWFMDPIHHRILHSRMLSGMFQKFATCMIGIVHLQ